MDNENYDRKCFWEVHYTYQDVSMWCQINRAAIVDEALKVLGLGPTALGRLTKWRDTLDNPQVIARMLWPRVCQAFLWSSNPDPSPAYWSSGVLHALHIYAYGKRLSVERAETRHLLDVEQDLAAQNASPKATAKQYGAFRGTLTTHFANVTLQVGTIDTRIQSREIAEDCLDAVKKAGRYDDLSGVCAYNVSVFLYEMVCQRRVPPGDELHVLRAAMDAVEEAIADDPEGSPRNYCHLGDIYRHLRWADGADTEEHSRKVIQTYQQAVKCDPDRRTSARKELYVAKADAYCRKSPPDLDAAVAEFERALVDDLANATSWYGRLVDLHKRRGDLASVRETYRRCAWFDPTCRRSCFEKIAATWIDQDSYKETRTFDWKNWCNALLEAVETDPAHAGSYWRGWGEEADRLSGY